MAQFLMNFSAFIFTWVFYKMQNTGNNSSYFKVNEKEKNYLGTRRVNPLNPHHAFL